MKILKIDSLDDYDTYIYIYLVYDVLCNIRLIYTQFKNFLKNPILPPKSMILVMKIWILTKLLEQLFQKKWGNILPPKIPQSCKKNMTLQRK